MNSLLIRTKIILPIFAGLILFTGGIAMDAKAQQFSTSTDMDADIVPRLSLSDAEFAISNQDKSIDLILTNDAIAFQFTENYLNGIADEIEGSDEMHDSASFAQIFKSVISKSVHSLLDRAISIPLIEIKQITYDNGKIVIINNEGEELFNNFEINDKQIMEDFSKRDAKRFVERAEKKMI